MTIIVFLVDTSASMNQRTYMGTTLLDIAKGAVETFMKIRARDPNSRWDRYMLLTFEDPPGNVKAGWKESHATFMKELKNLEAGSLTNLGPAIKHTLDLLNLNRMTSGIDTYGQGRCPFYLEPAIIITITDGRKMTSAGGIQQELNLPMNNLVPGSELTKEPFRWDQRVFGLVLRMGAVPPVESQTSYIPTAEDSPVDIMCDVTGGRTYAVGSQRMLMQCLESLVQKCQSGVVINFEKVGPDPNPLDEHGEESRSQTPTSQNNNSQAWQSCRRLIFVPRSAQKGHSVGHWPIPESFWPDLSSPTLPPRSAHPTVKFTCTSCEPMAIENLPFDKYELEPSPLTQYILERRLPNVAWQVFIAGSAKYSELGHPWGYLKASSTLSAVNLFVMPYNYTVLLPLLDDLFKIHKLKPTPKWRQQFDNYLKTMPVYYSTPLRRALSRMGVANLVPDQMDNCLSYSIVSYLKKLKNQAKLEYDRLIASVGQRVPPTEGIKVTSRSGTSLLERSDFSQLLHHHGSDMAVLKQELAEFNTLTLAVKNTSIRPHAYRNPFDITRSSLLLQVAKMRANFLQLSSSVTAKLTALGEKEHLHNMPVQDMGNYQEYLKKLPAPLREIDLQPVRQHTFGNPFKVNKNLLIDEADEAMPGQSAGRKRAATPDSLPSSPRPNKRKPGPLPRDIAARHLMSPVHSPTPLDISLDLSPPDTGPPEGRPPDLNHMDAASHLLDTAEEDSPELLANHTDAYLPEMDSEHLSLKQPSPEKTLHTMMEQNQHNSHISALKSRKLYEHNVTTLHTVLRLVKRPGNNYDNLFCQLQLIQGPVETRQVCLRRVVHEAQRFKKLSLVQMLEQYAGTLSNTDQSPQKNTANGGRPKSPIR